MPTRLSAALLIATIFLSELPAGAQQSTATPPAIVAPAASSTVVLPAGTVIPLNLLTSIPGRTKSEGQAIRAQVAFPVIVGDRVAIPANTYVDGTLDYITPPTPQNKHPNTFLNFKTLTFPNGYKVALPATDVSQLHPFALPAITPTLPYPQLAMARSHGPSATPDLFINPAFAPEPTPTPTPQVPTQPGPVFPAPPSHIGIVIGAVGLFVALTAGALLLSRHVSRSSSISPGHNAGWQFQITLQAPLTLDIASTTAPIKTN
jgi:hypothetical protein